MRLVSVESSTDPSKKYTVRQTKDGLRCSCPSFVFRETCKHLEQVSDRFDEPEGGKNEK